MKFPVMVSFFEIILVFLTGFLPNPLISSNQYPLQYPVLAESGVNLSSWDWLFFKRK
jgi:hypothetical protein